MAYEVRFTLEVEHPMTRITREHKGARGRVQVHRDNRGRLFTVHTLWAGRSTQRSYVRAYPQSTLAAACSRLESTAITPRKATWVAGPCQCAGHLGPCAAVQEVLDELDARLPGRSRLDAIDFQDGEATGLVTYFERQVPNDAHPKPLAARLVKDASVSMDGNPAEIDPVDARTLREAVRLGYYDQPRRVTMEDLAHALGVTKSAICRRLNKLENAAIIRLLDEVAGQGSRPSPPDGMPKNQVKVGWPARSTQRAAATMLH